MLTTKISKIVFSFILLCLITPFLALYAALIDYKYFRNIKEIWLEYFDWCRYDILWRDK